MNIRDNYKSSPNNPISGSPKKQDINLFSNQGTSDNGEGNILVRMVYVFLDWINRKFFLDSKDEGNTVNNISTNEISKSNGAVSDTSTNENDPSERRDDFDNKGNNNIFSIDSNTQINTVQIQVSMESSNSNEQAKAPRVQVPVELESSSKAKKAPQVIPEEAEKAKTWEQKWSEFKAKIDQIAKGNSADMGGSIRIINEVKFFIQNNTPSTDDINSKRPRPPAESSKKLSNGSILSMFCQTKYAGGVVTLLFEIDKQEKSIIEIPMAEYSIFQKNLANLKYQVSSILVKR